MEKFERYYSGKNVLIAGGLGFIGSNLADKLVGLGARVSIIDWRSETMNIDDFKDRIILYEGDVGKPISAIAVRGKDIIFDLEEVIEQVPLATDKLGKIKDEEEIEWSVRRHRSIADAAFCSLNQGLGRIVYPSSKVVYGDVDENNLPVKEDTPMRPLSRYAMVKARTEEMFAGFCNEGFDIRVLRLTVPYGPKSQIKHPGFGIVGWFMRQALEGNDVTVFGEGKQLADYVYVGDVVDALLVAGYHPNAIGKTYNVGSGHPTAVVDMAHEVVKAAKSGKVVHTPMPEDIIKSGKSGSMYVDTSKIKGELGWSPKYSFKKGIQKTADFYRGKNILMRYKNATLVNKEELKRQNTV